MVFPPWPYGTQRLDVGVTSIPRILHVCCGVALLRTEKARIVEPAYRARADMLSVVTNVRLRTLR